MKKIYIAAGILLLIILFVGLNIWQKSNTNSYKVDATSVKEEEIAETVMTPGTLKLEEQQVIYEQQESGQIAEFYVKEGDQVKKGDKLIRYEDESISLEKQQVQLQIQSTRMELNHIKEQHKDIDKQLEKDEDNEMLKEEHDQISLQEKKLNLELEQALLQQKSIDQQLDDLLVKSEIDGTVITLNKTTDSKTDQLNQQPIMQIGTLGDLIVEGTISEYETLKIKEDQVVRLSSDVLPDKKWNGVVSQISYLPKESEENMMDSDNGVLYPITVKVDEKLELKPGFQMLMEIEVSNQKSKTLPLTAVKQDGDKNYVYIVKDGKAKYTEVKAGTVSGDKIEIIDGLTKKDKVITDPNDEIHDGMDVNVK